MGSLSTLDVQTRLDVQELLSRFCHAVDKADGAAFHCIFSRDARYESDYLGTFETPEEVASIPDILAGLGKGKWRHHFTNLIIDRTSDARELEAKAFLTVRDCGAKGQHVGFADCVIRLHRGRHWQIKHFRAMPVCPSELPEEAETIAPAAVA